MKEPNMKISDAFPSKYLKADDLGGREARVIMDTVTYEKLGDDDKPILYFKGKEKGVVLNKTNANTISIAYGDDTDDWAGEEIILFSVMVDFQGKVGPAIRCRAPNAKDRRAAGASPRRDAAPARRAPQDDPITSGESRSAHDPRSDADMDDEIPF